MDGLLEQKGYRKCSRHFSARVLMLQAIMPCTEIVVWLHETRELIGLEPHSHFFVFLKSWICKSTKTPVLVSNLYLLILPPGIICDIGHDIL